MSKGLATTSLVLLEYSNRRRFAWVGQHRRALIAVACFIAVAVAAYRFEPTLEHRFLWLYWSHRAAAHTMPATSTEAYFGDALQIINSVPIDYPDYRTFALLDGTAQAVYSPLAYRRLAELDSRLNLTGGEGVPVIFMGTLRRPDGTPRLVIVTGGHGESDELLAQTQVLVLPLPRWFDPPPPPSNLQVIKIMPEVNRFSPRFNTRLQTGVVDSNDLSHISFEFTAEPYRSDMFPQPAHGVIDAHLKNDDSVAFTLRGSWGFDSTVSLGTSTMNGDVKSLETIAKAFPNGVVPPVPSLWPSGFQVRQVPRPGPFHSSSRGSQ